MRTFEKGQYLKGVGGKKEQRNIFTGEKLINQRNRENVGKLSIIRDYGQNSKNVKKRQET